MRTSVLFNSVICLRHKQTVWLVTWRAPHLVSSQTRVAPCRVNTVLVVCRMLQRAICTVVSLPVPRSTRAVSQNAGDAVATPAAIGHAPSRSTLCQKMHQSRSAPYIFFRCPPHGYLARWASGLLSMLALYVVLLVIVGKEQGLPGICHVKNLSIKDAPAVATSVSEIYSNGTNKSFATPYIPTSSNRHKHLSETKCSGGIFGLYVLFVCSMLASSLAKKLSMPPLLGMLLVGLLLKNVPYINVAQTISKEWSSALRNLALVVILTRAGKLSDFFYCDIMYAAADAIYWNFHDFCGECRALLGSGYSSSAVGGSVSTGIYALPSGDNGGRHCKPFYSRLSMGMGLYVR